MSEIKDASKRSITITGDDYDVVKRIHKDGKWTHVIQVPTPTEENPDDTRLYLGEDESFDPVSRERWSLEDALIKWVTAPEDSLTRGEYEELINPKEKLKKKRFFKRNK